jgi:chorismate mutase
MKNIISKQLYGIRGATCAENSRASIEEATAEMCSSLFRSNKLSPEDIVSIQFTLTADLDACNPASALRKKCSVLDISRTALFCSQEAYIQGELPHVIRVLVTAYMPAGSVPQHIFIRGAENLRPDFSKAAEK